jgi:hypothetical protein
MTGPTAERLLDWLALSPTRPRPDPSALTAADWDELIAQACRHGVAPQLFRRLLAAAREGPVPRGALQCVWLAAARQKAKAARLQQELPAVLRRLRTAGITPVLLKGAHLATVVYPDPALRPMDDFDLLVPRAELAAAEQALCAAGYTTPRTESIAEACARDHSLPTLLQAGTYPIELHWTLATPADEVPLDLEGLWDRAQRVTVYGESAYVLAPEDTLLHICLHATVHHLFDQGLRPLLDLVALLDRHGTTLDWNAVVARARAWDLERAVYLLLALARREADAVISDDVFTRLQPGGIPSAVQDAARAQLLELPFLGDVSTRSVAVASSGPRQLWDYVFSTRTAMAREYDARRHPLRLTRYYVARVQDLVGRYGRVAWQLVREDRGRLAAATGRVRREQMLRGWLARVRT